MIWTGEPGQLATIYMLILVPAVVVFMLLGEIVARKLAALKERQMYGGDEA